MDNRPPRKKRIYADLKASQRRARSGPVAVHYLPAEPFDASRYVAYAVPRRVGTAVERNTYRRRLRAVVRETAEEVAAGTYLIRVNRDICDISFEQLRSKVIESMQRAGGTR